MMQKFLVPLSILSILLALTVDSHARDNHLHPPHSPNSANPRQLSVECEKAGDPCDDGIFCNGPEICNENMECVRDTSKPIPCGACNEECDEMYSDCVNLGHPHCWSSNPCILSKILPENPCECAFISKDFGAMCVEGQMSTGFCDGVDQCMTLVSYIFKYVFGERRTGGKSE